MDRPHLSLCRLAATAVALVATAVPGPTESAPPSSLLLWGKAYTFDRPADPASARPEPILTPQPYPGGQHRRRRQANPGSPASIPIGFGPLRVEVVAESGTSAFVRRYMSQHVIAAVQASVQALYVMHTDEPLVLSRGYGLSDRTSWNDTGFVLQYNIFQTGDCASAPYLAYADTLEEDEFDDRPIAGQVWLSSCLFRSPRHTPTIITLVIHEMVHTLGFTSEHFVRFRDCSQAHLDVATGRRNCPRRTPPGSEGPQANHRAGGSTLQRSPSGELLVVTPTVVDVARAYFGCPSMEGVPLEDEGGGASQHQHWETRILAYETMNAAITVGFGDRYVLSELTLALLHDSGWYHAVLPAGGTALRWGRSQGCDFVQDNACQEPTFCSAALAAANQSGCSHMRLDKAQCGNASFFDGCSTWLPLKQGACVPSSRDSTGLHDYELQDSASRCFIAEQNGNGNRPYCFRHRCSVGHLKIEVGRFNWVDCDGTAASVGGLGGFTAQCPPTAELCNATGADRTRLAESIFFRHSDPTVLLETVDSAPERIESQLAAAVGASANNTIIIRLADEGTGLRIDVELVSSDGLTADIAVARLNEILHGGSLIVYFGDSDNETDLGWAVEAEPFSASGGSDGDDYAGALAWGIGVALALMAGGYLLYVRRRAAGPRFGTIINVPGTLGTPRYTVPVRAGSVTPTVPVNPSMEGSWTSDAVVRVEKARPISGTSWDDWDMEAETLEIGTQRMADLAPRFTEVTTPTKDSRNCRDTHLDPPSYHTSISSLPGGVTGSPGSAITAVDNAVGGLPPTLKSSSDDIDGAIDAIKPLQPTSPLPASLASQELCQTTFRSPSIFLRCLLLRSTSREPASATNHVAVGRLSKKRASRSTAICRGGDEFKLQLSNANIAGSTCLQSKVRPLYWDLLARTGRIRWGKTVWYTLSERPKIVRHASCPEAL